MILLTESEISARYKIPVATLRNWRCQRTGPGYLKVGRSVRYEEKTIEAFFAAHRVETGL